MTLNNQSINSQIKAIDIANQALDELGLPNANLINNGSDFATDFNTKQIKALLNACGNELSQNYDWQILRRPIYYETSIIENVSITAQTDGSFMVNNPSVDFLNIYNSGDLVNYNAVSTAIVNPNDATDITYQAYPYTRAEYVSNSINLTSVPYLKFIPQVPDTPSYTGQVVALPSMINLCRVRFPLPDDYVCLIDGTGWDYTRHFPLIGPTTEQEWAWLVNGFVATAPRIRWAIFNNSLNAYPSYNTPERLTFVYKSNGWCGTKINQNIIQPSTTLELPTYKNKVDSPNDIVFFNDRLMIAFIKYKLYSIKGLDTAALYQEYKELLNIAIAQDSGMRNLSMSPDLSNPFLSWNNLPDSGYSTYSQSINYV